MQSAIPFVETNVFVRHFTDDHPNYSLRSSAYFERIQRGEAVVQISGTVVFETVFTLQSFYRVPREIIRDFLLPILELPGIALPGKTYFPEIFAR